MENESKKYTELSDKLSKVGIKRIYPLKFYVVNTHFKFKRNPINHGDVLEYRGETLSGKKIYKNLTKDMGLLNKTVTCSDSYVDAIPEEFAIKRLNAQIRKASQKAAIREINACGKAGRHSMATELKKIAIHSGIFRKGEIY